RNERYKFGDKASEEAEFQHHADRVRVVQIKVARAELKEAAQSASGAEALERFPEQVRRVFHAKMHACLLGTLTWRPDRPAAVRHGIFADGGRQRYNVLARFSNGVGTDQHDLAPDVRGLALKIFGVSETAGGARDETRCVDWLMTNSTNPFGRDQEEFV